MCDPDLLVKLRRKMKNLFMKIWESQIFALKEVPLSEFNWLVLFFTINQFQFITLFRQ